MQRIILLVGVVLTFLVSAAFGESQTIKGEVRDASGKLLYKTYTRGNITETREPSGRLVTKSKAKNGATEVRSPTGKLLYKAK
jgi:hypothetical protein